MAKGRRVLRVGTTLATRHGFPALGDVVEGSAAHDNPAPVLCIVDDDEGTVELGRDVARESGWIAYGFRRIADARRFLSGRRPHLLVLDDDLPDGRGGDLARELREHPELRDVPLVVCTAAHPSRREEIGSWAPVISKPFDIFELERHLEASIHARPHPQQQASAG